MKVKNIHIKNFKQFQDFELDLTYPIGHPKAGFPLEKVCFIGQSGTGKTNLLNYILKGSLLGNSNESDIEDLQEGSSISIELDIKLNKTGFVIHKVCKKTKTIYKHYPNTNNAKLTKAAAAKEAAISEALGEEYINKLRERLHMYYFPAQADYLVSKQFYDKINKNASHIQLSDRISDPEININDLYLNQVLYYQQETINLVSDAISRLLTSHKEAEDEARINATYQAELMQDFNFKQYIDEWRKNNPNPIEKLFKSDLFSLLKELKVNFELNDINNKNFFDSIFKVDTGSITFDELSSGIRHLIHLMLPLIIVRDPVDNIVFVDEPETSLFPDIQKRFISLFTSISKESQYFFATHSPIIASSFQPEERFFLYFDDNNLLKYTRGVAPEGDDSNDLLTKDFKLETAFGEKGDKMHKHYIRLRMMIENERNLSKKQELAHEFLSIGTKYGF